MNSWLFLDIAAMTQLVTPHPEAPGNTGSNTTGMSFEAVLASLLDQAAPTTTGETEDSTQTVLPIAAVRADIPVPMSLLQSNETTRSASAHLLVRDSEGVLHTFPVTVQITSDDSEMAEPTVTVVPEQAADTVEIERVIDEAEEPETALVFGEYDWKSLTREQQNAPHATPIALTDAIRAEVPSENPTPVYRKLAADVAEAIQLTVAESVPAQAGGYLIETEPITDAVVSTQQTTAAMTDESVQSGAQRQATAQSAMQSTLNTDVPQMQPPTHKPDQSPIPESDTRQTDVQVSTTVQQTVDVPEDTRAFAPSVNTSSSAPASSDPVPVRSEQPVQTTPAIDIAPSVPSTTAPEPTEQSPDIHLPAVQVYLATGDADGSDAVQSVRQLPQTMTIHIVVDEHESAGHEVMANRSMQRHTEARSEQTVASVPISAEPSSAERPVVSVPNDPEAVSRMERESTAAQSLPPDTAVTAQSADTGETSQPVAPVSKYAPPAVSAAMDDSAPNTTVSASVDVATSISSDTAEPAEQSAAPADPREIRQPAPAPAIATSDTIAPENETPVRIQSEYPVDDTVRPQGVTLPRTREASVVQQEPQTTETRIEYYQRPVHAPEPEPAHRIVTTDARTVSAEKPQTPTSNEASAAARPLPETESPTRHTDVGRSLLADEQPVASDGAPVQAVPREDTPESATIDTNHTGEPAKVSTASTGRTANWTTAAGRSVEPHPEPLQQSTLPEEPVASDSRTTSSPAPGEAVAVSEAVTETAPAIQAAPMAVQAETRRHIRQESRSESVSARTTEPAMPMEATSVANGTASIVSEREPTFGETFSDDESFAPHTGKDMQATELTGDFSTPFSAAIQDSEQAGADTNTASARQSTAMQSTSADPAELAGTIVRHAVVMVKNGTSSAEISLDPPSLGKLKLDIVTENGKITGRITVETTEVRDLMQQNLAQLRESMAQSGLKVESFDVQVGHNGGTDSWARRETAQQLTRTGRTSRGMQGSQSSTVGAVVHTRQAVSLNTQLFDRWI